MPSTIDTVITTSRSCTRCPDQRPKIRRSQLGTADWAPLSTIPRSRSSATSFERAVHDRRRRDAGTSTIMTVPLVRPDPGRPPRLQARPAPAPGRVAPPRGSPLFGDGSARRPTATGSENRLAGRRRLGRNVSRYPRLTGASERFRGRRLGSTSKSAARTGPAQVRLGRTAPPLGEVLVHHHRQPQGDSRLALAADGAGHGDHARRGQTGPGVDPSEHFSQLPGRSACAGPVRTASCGIGRRSAAAGRSIRLPSAPSLLPPSGQLT